MTKEEFGKIAVIMKTCYPKESELLKTEHAVGLWYELLKDIDYTTMSMALNKWVTTERWSPTIADLRSMSYEVTSPEIKSWDEAWSDVLSAINRYGYNRQDEAMGLFDSITKKVVERIGWMTLCMTEEIGIERANFRDIYKGLADKTRSEGQMPPAVRKVIEATRESKLMMLEDGTHEEASKEECNVTEFSDDIEDRIKKVKENLKTVMMTI